MCEFRHRDSLLLNFNRSELFPRNYTRSYIIQSLLGDIILFLCYSNQNIFHITKVFPWFKTQHSTVKSISRSREQHLFLMLPFRDSMRTIQFHPETLGRDQNKGRGIINFPTMSNPKTEKRKEGPLCSFLKLIRALSWLVLEI